MGKLRYFLIGLITSLSVFFVVTESKGQIALLVEDAISRGVPLYNNGDYVACVEVYRLCLRSLQLLSSEEYPEITVERALVLAAKEPSQKAAWTLRYALDEVYLNSVEGSSMNESMLQLDMNGSRRWYSLNDNVMGGISRGDLKLTPDGTGIFSGQLSLASNGGFSSVRTGVSKGGLTKADGIKIKVKGDRRKYSVMLGTDEMRGSWQASFIAGKDWSIVRIPFEKFSLSVRGWNPQSAPSVPRSRVSTVGIIIGDKDERPFMLQIDSISGYVNDTKL